MKLIPLFLVLPLVLPAADVPWKSRQPADWTPREAARILMDSPWAKTVSAGGDFGPMDGPPAGEPDGPGTGPGMDAPNFVIRWESAAPVRAAAARFRHPHHDKITELSAQYYVISLSLASDPLIRRATSAPPTPLSVLAGLAESATLRLKGQDPLVPEKIESLESADNVTTLFLFPRTNAISLSHKDAAFEIKLGSTTLKTRFPIKDMLWEGSPSL